MGRLDEVVDMTGSSSQMDLNSQNIQQVIDELNRNSDQLDAIANGLNIIGRGSLSGTWDGTAGGQITLKQAHGFSQAPIFLASFTRSDMPGQFFPVPMWFYDTAGNYQSRVYDYTDATNINLTFVSAISGSPTTFVFSWYIIQQPAQVPTGS